MSRRLVFVIVCLILWGCQSPSGVQEVSVSSGEVNRILTEIQDILHPVIIRDDIASISKQWQRIDTKFEEMIKGKMIDYDNKMLGVNEAGLLGELHFNNHHPRLKVIDLDKDRDFDLIVSAHTHHMAQSRYSFLVYINNGRRLEICLRHIAFIENGLDIPSEGYSLSWDETEHAYVLNTFQSELVDYHARRFFTLPVIFYLKSFTKKK